MRYNSKAFAQRGIAQLVEQRSPKPRAEGSNPSAPAKALTERSELFLFPSPILPPLCKGRWRTNVSRRGCRHGAGEGGLVPEARSYTLPTTPQSNPSGLPAPLTQGSQALRGTKVSCRGSQACGGNLPIKKAALSSLTKRLRSAILMSVRTAASASGGRPEMEFRTRWKRRLPLWWAVISYV